MKIYIYRILMKKLKILIFLLIFPLLTFSQKISDDQVIKINSKGEQIEYIIKDWGIQFSSGMAFTTYGEKTNNYFPNHESVDFGLLAYYRRFQLGIQFRPMTVNPKQSFMIDGNMISESDGFNIVKTYLTSGSCFNLPLNFDLTPYVYYVRTNFTLIVENEENVKYSAANGTGGGLRINKYIRLRSPGKYLVGFVYADYSISDYTQLNRGFGNSFYSLGFGFAFKWWFIHKINHGIL